MSRSAWALEPAAPRKRVWVQTCDVCKRIHGAPAWTQEGLASLDNLRAQGWRCLSNPERAAIHDETGKWLPWDTCDSCLSRESLEGYVNETSPTPDRKDPDHDAA